jgi:hypothetical protein
MQTLARFLVLAAELAETEGRLLRAESSEFAWALLRGLALSLFTVTLLVVSAALVLLAIFIRVESESGPVAAALTTAGVALFAAACTAWLARSATLRGGA